MNFSIVTPSFRSAEWLPLCIASIADQEGVQVEHIVQDSCSDDATPEILRASPRVKAFIEKDSGMYDAINRGMGRAQGDLLAYLNCDEQYLPGALRQVHEHFAAHPEVDAVVADSIITDGAGDYLCHRCSLVPRENEMWIRFPVLTSAFFLRRRVFHEMGIRCDTTWLALGDWVWVMEMVKRGVRFSLLPQFTSSFTDTGDNLALKPVGLKEMRQKRDLTPKHIRWLRGWLTARYRLRLAARGAMTLKPFTYSIYTRTSPAKRVTKDARKPTSFWLRR